MEIRMSAFKLARLALWLVSAILGGTGMACLVASFAVPVAGAYALAMLGAASAIVLYSPA
jgi:hypothetical protein